MPSVDKNEAFIAFLKTCPSVAAKKLYFNFSEVGDSNFRISVDSDVKLLNKQYLDGSELKRYTVIVDCYRSVSSTPLPATGSVDSIDAFKDIQSIMDWIALQADSNNFPNFGNDCIIESMSPSSNKPQFMGVDTSKSKNIALYKFSVDIDFIDKSRAIWS